MATYAENAHRRAVQARRDAQDRRDAALHRQFDLSAQDQHHKYERFRFSIATASDAFRRGYDAIEWGDTSPRR